MRRQERKYIGTQAPQPLYTTSQGCQCHFGSSTAMSIVLVTQRLQSVPSRITVCMSVHTVRPTTRPARALHTHHAFWTHPSCILRSVSIGTRTAHPHPSTRHPEEARLKDTSANIRRNHSQRAQLATRRRGRTARPLAAPTRVLRPPRTLCSCTASTCSHRRVAWAWPAQQASRGRAA